MARTRRVSGRHCASKVIGGAEIKVHIDLSQHLGVCEFDDVMQALSDVVGKSASLSLDDARDRETLVDRLAHALGAVVP